jgi:hypothetical protein
VTLHDVQAARAELAEALRAAHLARRGAPAALEELTRVHARLSREAGADIAEVIRDVKALVYEATGADELLFTGKIVGWTVAGYFLGT